MYSRKGHSCIDVLFWLNTSRQLWYRQSMAFVFVLGKFVEIFLWQAGFRCMPPCCLFPFGKCHLVCSSFIANHHYQLPDSTQDAIPDTCSPSQKNIIMTHCHGELMQHVWKVILDNDFKEAYEHGFVVECLDGRSRRFYPRLFTYSADYPKKYAQNTSHIAEHLLITSHRILLTCIWDKGLCPCPWCLVL